MNVHPGDLLYYQSEYLNLLPEEQTLDLAAHGVQIAVTHQNGMAYSYSGAPFGGFWGDCTSDEFSNIIDTLCLKLRNLECHQLEVRQAPGCYPNQIPDQWLLDHRFKIKEKVIGHFLDLKKPFISGLHLMERRKLKKSAELSICQVGNELLFETFQFIQNCRIEQGIPLNINFERLHQQVTLFSEQYQQFHAYHHDELIAAVITTLPCQGIAYYFLAATAGAYRHFSPMVALLAHIHENYQKKGFKFLDLGISTYRNQPQNSLITFKKHMGGIRDERITYLLNL